MAIAGATEKTFIVTAAEQEKQIDVEVTPVATKGKKHGTPVRSAKTNAVASDLSILAIAGVTPPIKGAIPVASLADTAEYTVSIVWSPSAVTFAANEIHSGSITAVFPATEKEALVSVSISGNSVIGEILSADQLTPATATVSYQWQRCLTTDGIYTDLTEETFDHYTVAGDDFDYYLKVTVTGTGSYSGSITSAATSKISNSSVALTAIDVISGTAEVAKQLTAGEVSPSGATVTYQWQRCLTLAGDFEDIFGATANTYTPAAEDLAYYLKVVATGSGGSIGTKISDTAGPVMTTQAAPIASLVSISGTAQVGQTLTGSYTYSDVNDDLEGISTFQWYAGSTVISGATKKTLILTASELGTLIRFEVTPVAASGTITGLAVLSDATAVVVENAAEAAPIASLVSISGTAQVGQTLTGSYTYSDVNNDCEGSSTY